MADGPRRSDRGPGHSRNAAAKLRSRMSERLAARWRKSPEIWEYPQRHAPRSNTCGLRFRAAYTAEVRRASRESCETHQMGSSCGAMGKVQVERQVKVLPAPQLLPENAGQHTLRRAGKPTEPSP